MRIPKGGIAFFDSGIGGLTVLAECRKYLKKEVFYYYGDNERAPYGNLSPKKIRRYVFRAFRRFRRLRVKAAVVACNTVTAVCIDELREKYSFPIIGAEPAVLLAARHGGEGYILATKATCESERFQKLCKKAYTKYPSSSIKPIACEKLAGEIEENLLRADYDYLPFLPEGKPNVVALGCTHYIYIKKYIEAFYGCPTVDGNEGIAKELLRVLANDDEKNKNRDERPPFFHFFKKCRPFPTTYSPHPKKKQKKNKRSCKKLKNTQKSVENEAFFNVFFLGSRKNGNKRVYEQMFAPRKSS